MQIHREICSGSHADLHTHTPTPLYTLTPSPVQPPHIMPQSQGWDFLRIGSSNSLGPLPENPEGRREAESLSIVAGFPKETR